MAKLFKENTQAVLSYLQDNTDSQNTAASIAEALGLPKKSVDGILTGLQRETSTHPQLIKRVVVEGVEGKVIELTAAGADADPDADRPEKE